MTPYGVPQDADLDRGVLDSRNGGEESMMSFVRHHILKSLEPLSEDLRQLRQEVAHLSKDQALSDAKVEEQGATLRKVDDELLALRNSNSGVANWMNRTQVEMQKEAEVRARVESDVDSAKAAAAKANERHQHCMASVESLDRKLSHLHSNFSSVKELLAKAETDIQTQDKSLLQLKDAHNDLVTHHGAAAKKLQSSAERSESLERDVQRLFASHQHHCEETIINLEDLNQHLKQVHAQLDGNVDVATKNRAELKQTAEFVKSMRNNLGHKDNTCYRLDSMQARDEEMHNALKKHLEAFEHLQRLVEGLSGGPLSGGDGPSQPRGSLGSDLVEELRVKVEAHDQNIDKIGSVQAMAIEQIKDAAMAIERLQRDGRRVKDYAEGTNRELAGLSTSHKQANSRMESHAIDHNRLQSDLQGVKGDLDSNLKQVKGDLGSASSALARLRSNYDATNTNMFGLAKGFQDAGRQVVSPLKSARGPLPSLEPRGPASRILGDAPYKSGSLQV